MNASMIFFTLARLNQSTKYMLKVAAEMQSNLKNKAPERCQRCSGVYLHIKLLNPLKLFWFTVDYSVLLNEGGHFFVCIADCQSELLIAIETRYC